MSKTIPEIIEKLRRLGVPDDCLAPIIQFHRESTYSQDDGKLIPNKDMQTDKTWYIKRQSM